MGLYLITQNFCQACQSHVLCHALFSRAAAVVMTVLLWFCSTVVMDCTGRIGYKTCNFCWIHCKICRQCWHIAGNDCRTRIWRTEVYAGHDVKGLWLWLCHCILYMWTCTTIIAALSQFPWVNWLPLRCFYTTLPPLDWTGLDWTQCCMQFSQSKLCNVEHFLLDSTGPVSAQTAVGSWV